MGDRVQVLRVNGFLFFGSANGLLERIRKRAETDPPRFLVIDLGRVTGVDSSAVVAFVKALHLAEAAGFELVFTGTSDAVRSQMARGGLVASDIVRFEPDLDRGLQRCEEGLLRDEAVEVPESDGDALAGMPSGLRSHLERMELPDGTVLIRQGQTPDDVYVLETGRLRVETVTERGTRMRLRTLRPGVVVGEVAMYSGNRGPPTWWPRARAWSRGSAGARSSGSRPTIRSSPQRSIDGSRGRWRGGWVTRSRRSTRCSTSPAWRAWTRPDEESLDEAVAGRAPRPPRSCYMTSKASYTVTLPPP